MQLAVGAVTTHATVDAPIVVPTVYVVPSTGVSVTALTVRRNTIIEPRSTSPGFVHASATCVPPAVAVDAVTLPGERLSIVTVVPAASEPACPFVPVHALINAVTE